MDLSKVSDNKLKAINFYLKNQTDIKLKPKLKAVEREIYRRCKDADIKGTQK